MSSVIDRKVVEMQFDNAQFERNVQTSMSSIQKLKQALKFDGISNGVQNINNSIKGIDLSAMADGIASIERRFSTLGIIGMTVISELTKSAMEFAKNTIGNVTNMIVSGGTRRAMNIENAHFQLQGLLKDEEKVQAVMDNAMESVDGTAYAYDEAAKAASQFAASGMEAGDEMLSSLRAITGVAAMTNSEYEDISRVFTTVAGNGRLMGDQLLQLSSRGLNAAATLADYVQGVQNGSIECSDSIKAQIEQLNALGGGMEINEAAIRDFVSKGAISFQLFSAAMDDAFGEHAKKANETFNGALSNIRAALSRMGAKFISPLVEQNGPLVLLFNTIRVKINEINKLIDPLANSFTKFVNKLADAFRHFTGNLNLDPVKTFVDIGSKMFDLLYDIVDIAIKVLPPFEAFGTAVDNLTDKFIKVTEKGLNPFIKAGKDLGIISTESVETVGENLNEITDREVQAAIDIWTQGAYGTGEARRQAIEEAGMDYERVQDILNQLANGTITLEELIDQAGQTSETAFEKTTTATTQSWKEIKKAEDRTKILTNLMEGLNNIGDSLGNTFEFLGQVVEIASASFRSIFKVKPVELSEAFLDLTEKIEQFTEKLKKNHKLAVTIRHIFDNLFESVSNVFGTVQNIFEGLSQYIRIAITSFQEFFNLDPVGITGGIKDITDKIENFTEKLKLSDEGADKLRRTFNGVWAVFDLVGQAIGSVAKGLGDLLQKFIDTNPFGLFKNEDGSSKSILDYTAALGDWLVELDEVAKKKGIFKAISDAISGFGSALGEAHDRIKEFTPSLEPLKSGLKTVWDNLSKIFGNITLDKIVESIKAGALGYIIYKITEFVTSLSKGAEAIKSIPTQFSEILEGVGDTLKAYQGNIKADTLLKIAKAIGILAASVFALGLLDGEQLLTAVIALLTIVEIYVVAVKLLDPFKSESDAPLSMVGVIDKFLTSMSANIGKAAKLIGAAALFVSLGIAVKILAGVMTDIINAHFETMDVVKSLAWIGILIGELTAAAVAMSKFGSNFGVGAGVGILAMAFAIKVLEGPLKTFAEMTWEQMLQGLIGIGALLAALELVAVGLKENKAVGALTAIGVGLIAIAAGLTIMMIPVELMAHMGLEELAKGIGGVVVVMLAMAAAAQIANGALGGAAAMVVMSVALIGMSAALVVFAAAMVLVDQACKDPLTDFLVLAVGLEAMILAGYLAQGCIPGLLALAAGLVALGIAAAGIGIGVLAASIGLTIFATGIALLVDAIIDACQKISDNQTVLSSGIAAMIGAVVTAIKDKGPDVIDAFISFVMELARSIGENATKLAALTVIAFLAFVDGVAKGIADNAQTIFDTVHNIMNSLKYVLMLSLVELGDDIWNAILGWIENIIPGGGFIADKIRGVINPDWETIRSDLREKYEEGRRDIANGIDGIAETAEDHTHKGTGAVFQAIEDDTPDIERAASGYSEAAVGAMDFSGFGSNAETSIDDMLKIFSDQLPAGTGMANTWGTDMTSMFGDNLDFANMTDAEIGDMLTSMMQRQRDAQMAARDMSDQMTNELDRPEVYTTIGTGNASGYVDGVYSQEGEALAAGEALEWASWDGAGGGYWGMNDQGWWAGQGYVDGILSQLGAAAGAGAQLGIEAGLALAGAQLTGSPAKKFVWQGEFAGQGYVLGLQNYADAAADAGADLANGSINAVQDALHEVSDALANDLDVDPTIRPVLDLSEIQNGVNKASDLIGGIGGEVFATSADAARMTARSMNHTDERRRQAEQIDDDRFDRLLSLLESFRDEETENGSPINNTFNIHGANPREIADEVSRIIQKQVERKEASWA